MKIFIILSIIFNIVIAKSQFMSDIPVPKNIFINIDTDSCDKQCLEDLLKKEQIFSFLSLYKNHSQEDFIQFQYEKYKNIFTKNSSANIIKIAMLIPQKSIKRYAISTVNAVVSYLIYKNYNFDLKVYNSNDEKEESLKNQISKIREDGYSYVIAPLTVKGAKIIKKYSNNLIIYIPTVNRSKIQTNNPSIYFGGISYKKQIEKLMNFANNKIAIFSDSSYTAYELNKEVKFFTPNIVFEKILDKTNQNFKKILKWNKKLDGASIFLNLPLIKTSLLVSQFRVYKREPYKLLSTQINFNPMILTLTQYADRKNMLIANSVREVNPQITNYSAVLGSDIRYDWVNYSTILGIDFLFNEYLTQSKNRNFQEQFINNQANYSTTIVSPTRYKLEAILR